MRKLPVLLLVGCSLLTVTACSAASAQSGSVASPAPEAIASSTGESAPCDEQRAGDLAQSKRARVEAVARILDCGEACTSPALGQARCDFASLTRASRNAAQQLAVDLMEEGAVHPSLLGDAAPLMDEVDPPLALMAFAKAVRTSPAHAIAVSYPFIRVARVHGAGNANVRSAAERIRGYAEREAAADTKAQLQQLADALRQAYGM